jgi:tetratricopeptide (TPR) repeat protein
MPKGNTLDIPHVVTTDHYIRIPVKNEDKEKVKKFITLYDVNNPTPSNYTIGRAFIQQFASFQSDYPLLLDSAKHYFPDNTPAEIKKNIASLIDISFYKFDYQKLTYYVSVVSSTYLLDSLLTHEDYANMDAWSAYRIGEAYYNLNDFANANIFYTRATKLAPYILDFQNKLALSFAMTNRHEEEEKVYNYILTLNADDAFALTNKGFLELEKGHPDLAKQCYDKALANNPDDHHALMNTAGWYIYEKQYSKAREYLEMVLKKYPDDNQAKDLISKVEVLNQNRKGNY